jgi:ankyrin repeat protein
MTNEELLIEAAKEGNLEAIKFLVENGTSVNTWNDAAFYWAACYGHLEVVKFLVENGAKFSKNDDWGFCYAAGNGHLKVVKYLIEQGITINKYDYAFYLATENKQTEVIDYFNNIIEKEKQNQIDTQTINIDKNVKKLIVNFEE